MGPQALAHLLQRSVGAVQSCTLANTGQPKDTAPVGSHFKHDKVDILKREYKKQTEYKKGPDHSFF